MERDPIARGHNDIGDHFGAVQLDRRSAVRSRIRFDSRWRPLADVVEPSSHHRVGLDAGLGGVAGKWRGRCRRKWKRPAFCELLTPRIVILFDPALDQVRPIESINADPRPCGDEAVAGTSMLAEVQDDVIAVGDHVVDGHAHVGKLVDLMLDSGYVVGVTADHLAVAHVQR